MLGWREGPGLGLQAPSAVWYSPGYMRRIMGEQGQAALAESSHCWAISSPSFVNLDQTRYFKVISDVLAVKPGALLHGSINICQCLCWARPGLGPGAQR